MPRSTQDVTQSIGSVDVVEDVLGNINITEIGVQGPRGASAYEIAVAQGFVGTVDQWLTTLRGVTVINAGDLTPPAGTPVGVVVFQRVS